MVLTLKLSQDNGAEISSLHIPLPQSDYLLLSAEELAEQFITPYLENLRTDEILWAWASLGKRRESGAWDSRLLRNVEALPA